MGASFSVVFQKKVRPFGRLGADHTELVRAQKKLDALAEVHGLVSLGRFESYGPEDVADQLRVAQGWVDLPADLPPEEWFDPAEGLAAVRALLAHLRAHPSELRDSGPVLADLEGIEAELALALRRGVQFHFAVVP
jgi:hypothetical protein